MRRPANRCPELNACRPHALALAAALVAAAAAAQDNGPQQIVVTAQKVAESPQRVPLSLTALGGESLADAGVKNLLNLQGMVTGVAIIDQGPGASVQIRGVGSNPGGGNVDPSAAFSVDGVYQSRSSGAFGAMYDVSRVEVLKGPQGTLYGRNATVGAINVISNDPGKKSEVGIDAETGNYNLRRVSGFVNMPLSETVQARVAAQIVHHDGYLSDGYNDANDRAARLKLLARLDEASRLLLTADFHLKSGNGQGNIFLGTVTTTPLNSFGLVTPGTTFTQTHTPARDNPSDPWYLAPSTLNPGNVNTTPATGTGHAEPANAGLRIANRGFTIDYSRDIGSTTLSVVPAYRASYALNQGGTGGNLIVPTYNLIDSEQRSLEVRWASDPKATLRWITGLYWLDEDAPTTSISRAQTGASTTFTVMNDVNARSLALFGQGTYSVSPALRVTAGLRGTQDDKSQGGRIFQVSGQTLNTGATNYTPSGAPISADGRYSSSSTDYKLGLDMDLAAETMAYSSLSTGYKAGGLNFSGAGGARQTYDPETLRALALGIKHRGLQGRLQLNAEVFDWRYRNQQIAVLDQLDAPGQLRGSSFANVIFLNNSGTSKIRGFDIDAIYHLTDDDRFNVSLAYLRARNGNFTTSQTVGAAIVIPGVGNIGAPAFQASTDLTGKVMPFSPTWTMNLGYSHAFNLASGASITAATDWHLETESYVNYNLFAPERQPGYGKGNVSAIYASAKGDFSVQGWVRNVSNKAVLTRGSVLGSTGGTIAHYGGIADPRTYGVTMGVRF